MSSRLNYSLTQLEYLLAVARHGHFARAAESCNVTQPTLSMQVQKLEEILGVTIFDRSKKPILLTQIGRQIIDQAQAVVSEAKRLELIVQSSKQQGLQGQLKVGIIPTLAPYLLPRVLPSVEKLFPQMELKVLELQTSRIVEALNNDEIDVGLLAIPLRLPRITERSLFFEPFYVLCQKDHELSGLSKIKYADLKYQDIWLLEEGHCLRHQVIDLCSIRKKEVDRKFQFESGSLETLKNLVATYGGYTLLPALAIDQVSSKTRLIPFERPIPAREVGLAFRREQYKADLIGALGDAIVAAIPEELKRLRQRDLDVLDLDL